MPPLPPLVLALGALSAVLPTPAPQAVKRFMRALTPERTTIRERKAITERRAAAASDSCLLSAWGWEVRGGGGRRREQKENTYHNSKGDSRRLTYSSRSRIDVKQRSEKM
eukprot:21540-Eustigmatos_ZCMA.PRE.1